MLNQIEKAVKHDITYNHGTLLSISLKEIIWLIEQAKKAEGLEIALAAERSFVNSQFTQKEE